MQFTRFQKALIVANIITGIAAIALVLYANAQVNKFAEAIASIPTPQQITIPTQTPIKWDYTNETVSSTGLLAANLETDNGFSLIVHYNEKNDYWQIVGVTEAASWSPDGIHIAFVKDAEVRILDVTVDSTKVIGWASVGTGIMVENLDQCQWTSNTTIACQ